MGEEKVDVLVIGAGPSGSVAAAYLHKQGLKIKVVEKNVFPRFVIGESLIPRCMDHFEAVGLLPCLESKNFEIKRGARFVSSNRGVCNFDFSEKYSEGWDWTWQVPRADFDMAMTDELQKWGVDIDFQKEVIAVSRQCFVVADHTKFRSSAFVSTANFDQIDGVITTNLTDPHALEVMTSAGLEVIVA